MNNKIRYIGVGLLIFGTVCGLLYTLNKPNKRSIKKLHKLQTIPLQPNIITSDGTLLAYSKPLYKLMIDTNYIKKCSDKNDSTTCALLHSVEKIANVSQKKILLESKRPCSTYYTTITYSLDAQNALILKNLVIPPITYLNRDNKDPNLKQYIQALFDGELFRTLRYHEPIQDIYALKPLVIMLSGEKRYYPQNDLLEPMLGYTHKREINGITKRIGVNGIEALANKTNTTLKTTIIYKKQLQLEKEVDKIKKVHNASEVMAVLLDLKNGNIEAIASTKRYNPNHITQEDIQKGFLLNINRYLFSLNETDARRTKEKNEMNKILQICDFNKSNSNLPFETNGIGKSYLKLNFLQILRLSSMFYVEHGCVYPHIIDKPVKNSKVIQQNSFKIDLQSQNGNLDGGLPLKNFHLDPLQTTLELPDGNRSATFTFKREGNVFKVISIINKQRKAQ